MCVCVLIFKCFFIIRISIRRVSVKCCWSMLLRHYSVIQPHYSSSRISDIFIHNKLYYLLCTCSINEDLPNESTHYHLTHGHITALFVKSGFILHRSPPRNFRRIISWCSIWILNICTHTHTLRLISVYLRITGREIAVYLRVITTDQQPKRTQSMTRSDRRRRRTHQTRKACGETTVNMH